MYTVTTRHRKTDSTIVRPLYRGRMTHAHIVLQLLPTPNGTSGQRLCPSKSTGRSTYAPESNHNRINPIALDSRPKNPSPGSAGPGRRSSGNAGISNKLCKNLRQSQLLYVALPQLYRNEACFRQAQPEQCHPTQEYLFKLAGNLLLCTNMSEQNNVMVRHDL